MRPTAAAALAVLTVLVGLPAAAIAADGPKVPGPPPAIKRVTSPAMNLLISLETWQRDAASGACFANEPTLETDIKNTLTRIQNHQDPAERQAAADWWDHEMRPWLQAWTQGVPGVGSYAEIARRRDASLAALKAFDPYKKPQNDAELLAYAKAFAEHKKRAKADYEFLEKLRAQSACFKTNRLDDLNGQLGLFGGYQNWHRMVDDIALRRLDEVRANVMPAIDDGEARKVMAKLAGVGDDQLARAEYLDDAYGALKRIRADEPRAAIVAAFADSFDEPERRAAVAATAERVAAARADLEKTIAAEMGKLRLLPESTGKEKGIVKSMFKNPQVIHARATSPYMKGTGHDTGHLEADNKKYIYTSNTAFEGFDIQYVAREHKPFWADVPGVPLSDVCSLYVAKARKYSKGYDRKLGSWDVAYADTARPVLCKAR